MTPEALAQRKPVWLALAELYLDTELAEADFARLAAVVRAAGFSWAEAQRINVEEVAPVVISNLWSVAGAWAGFDEKWLCEAILRRVGKGPPRLLGSQAWWRRLVEWHLRDCLPNLARHF
jgi:hypothetical protein